MRLSVHSARASYYKGGAERYILNLCTHLTDLNVDVSLVTCDAPEKSEWFKEFIKNFKGKIFLIRSKELDKKFKKFKEATKPWYWDKESILFSKATNNFYEKSGFTDISYHYTVDCLGLPKNKKIHLHLHGLPDKKRLIENKGIKIPHQIIAVSKYVRNGWKKLHNIKKKIYVVYNAINLEDLLYNRKKIYDTLYFGRLIKIKGVDTLIKSILLLQKKGVNINCTIIGDGPEKENLIRLAQKNNLKNIKFLGRICDKKLFDIISKSKISIFPSYKREGIMATLLEAAKFKSVIISSDSCSNKEFVKDKKNGLIFKSKDPKDLANKIERIIDNEYLRTRLSKNAFRYLKNFSWKKQAEKVYNIYKSIS